MVHEVVPGLAVDIVCERRPLNMFFMGLDPSVTQAEKRRMIRLMREAAP